VQWACGSCTLINLNNTDDKCSCCGGSRFLGAGAAAASGGGRAPSAEAVRAMGMRAMQAYLRGCGVDLSGCVEKSELMALALDTLAASATTTAAAAAAASAVASGAAGSVQDLSPSGLNRSHLAQAWKPDALGKTLLGVSASA
jgi:hypothetical protein